MNEPWMITWSDWDLESNLFPLWMVCAGQILHGFVEDRDATQGPGQACWAEKRLTLKTFGKRHIRWNRLIDIYTIIHISHIIHIIHVMIYSGSSFLCYIWKATSIKGNPMELLMILWKGNCKQLQGCVDRCSVRSSQKEVASFDENLRGYRVTCNQCTGFHGYLIGGGMVRDLPTKALEMVNW